MTILTGSTMPFLYVKPTPDYTDMTDMVAKIDSNGTEFMLKPVTIKADSGITVEPGAPISGLVTPTQLTSGLAAKADTTAVNSAMSAKADATAVTAALADKVSTAAMTSAMSTKADQTAVTAALAEKVSTSAMTTALAAKADTTAVNSAIASAISGLPAARRIDTYSGVTDASGNFTVTYATPFATKPSVQPEPPALANQTWTLTASSTTGFTVKLSQRNTVNLLSTELLLGTTVAVVGAAARVVVIAP